MIDVLDRVRGPFNLGTPQLVAAEAVVHLAEDNPLPLEAMDGRAEVRDAAAGAEAHRAAREKAEATEDFRVEAWPQAMTTAESVESAFCTPSN